ncbi:MAG: RNA polymerase sigma factor, partial [Solirubrobacteraceae bacterium]
MLDDRSQNPPLGVNVTMDFLEASDGELLAASRSEPDAFAAFYDRYEGSVVGYFARRTGDPEVAADLTAEVFAAALGASHRYRPETPSAAGWLFAIAHNKLLKSLRSGRVEADARRRLGIGSQRRGARWWRVRFLVPLSSPCVRFSRTRLSDDLLGMAYA